MPKNPQNFAGCTCCVHKSAASPDAGHAVYTQAAPTDGYENKDALLAAYTRNEELAQALLERGVVHPDDALQQELDDQQDQIEALEFLWNERGEQIHQLNLRIIELS